MGGFGTSRGLLAILMAANLAAANNPIATVTAGRSVFVNGVDVSTQGIPTWPLVAGDEVATTTEQAIVTLDDGSHFALEKNSKVKIERCGGIVVEVLQGTTTYRFASGSKAQLCVLSRPVRPATLVEGTVTIETPDRAVVRTVDQRTVALPPGKCLCSTGASRKTVIILILAGVGAAALALGIGLSLPSSVSPSTPTQ
jgi:hypothetical protein